MPCPIIARKCEGFVNPPKVFEPSANFLAWLRKDQS
jgi:hypothetical protein